VLHWPKILPYAVFADHSCQVQADNVNLQLGAVSVLNHGAKKGVLGAG
jgi:hypothetical protein